MEYSVYSTLVNTLFLDLQIKSFNKFLPGSKFIVLNNGRTDAETNNITEHCQEKNIECIRPKHGKFNVIGISHQETINWAYKNLISKGKEDCSIIVDFDIFPIDYPNLEKEIKSYDLCGLKQGDENISYLWPGLIISGTRTLNLSIIKELDFRGAMINPETNDYYICDKEQGFTWEEYEKKIKGGYKPFDSGAMLHFIWKRFKLNVKEYSLNLEVKDKIPKTIVHLYDPTFGYWLINNTWLHFGRGSNWDSMDESYFTKKISFLNCWMNEVLT